MISLEIFRKYPKNRGLHDKHGYPTLDEKEQHAMRVIANLLHENIKSESSKSLEMYKQQNELFVRDGST